VTRIGRKGDRDEPDHPPVVGDLLPEAWISPPAVRQLRALLRHRIQLVRLRTLLRNRIHAALAGHGQDRAGGCWSGPGRR
jgi:transposase